VAGKTKIEWADATWNPVAGCQRVSPGCAHCYARDFAERWRGVEGHPYEYGFDVRLWPSRLDYPLRWKRPRVIFVNSMGDLFHQEVPDSYIERVFAVMRKADWHVFVVMTKRHHRLAKLGAKLDWPPNVWMGVTVENRAMVHRVEFLRSVPAAVRYIAAEPLLGPLEGLSLDGIDWVVAGGESGPRHRPLKVEWVRDLRDRCVAAGVPFFFKQHGGLRPWSGGRELDGRTWDEWPDIKHDGPVPALLRAA
jgi:protein gp37